LDGKFYRTRRTLQTWLHPTTTFSHRWGTRLQSSTSPISKKLKNGSMNGLAQRRNSFFGMASINCLRDGQNVQKKVNSPSNCGEKRPEYQKRQHKVILLHDNAPSHTAKLVKETIEAFSWEILSHAAYSPDLAPSDYYLFVSMGHALAEQRFTSYENVRKWLDDWFASKEQQFFWCGIHKLSNRWEKCVSDGQYF
ncbi:Histone-lysine N-methyltransferase SETMAR, partial [Harpegnathos saltator]